MIKLICILFFISNTAFSKFDSALSTQLRSYPSLAGSIDLNLGYSELIWGEQSSLFHGLINTTLTASSSIVVHDYNARVTLYPISFIGIGAGHQSLTSNFDEFVNFDCDSIRCEGNLKRDYVFGKMALGFKNIVATFQYLESRNRYSFEDETKTLPVAEYVHLVEANPGSDEFTNQTYFLGYKLDQNLIGLVSDRVYYHISKQTSVTDLIFYKKRSGSFETLYGLGTFRSDIVEPGFLATVRFKYFFGESLASF